MAWVGTAYDFGSDGTMTVTELHTPDHPNGKHGNYGFHLKGVHDETDKFIPIDNPDNPVFVMVHDNSDDGLTHEEMKRIAERAIWNTVYWNDDLLRYCMWDFKVWDHWCEMIDVPYEPYWECMHINVYS